MVKTDEMYKKQHWEAIPAPSRRVPGEYPFYPKPLAEGAIYVQPASMVIMDEDTRESRCIIDYSKQSER